MLDNAEPVAFIPSQNLARSRRFYEQTLGLALAGEDSFAVVFRIGGITLRVTNVSNVKDFKPHSFTALGWHVPDATLAVQELTNRGIVFERFPGIEQDSLGIWSAPSGSKVAWFKDPEGNILSISQS